MLAVMAAVQTPHRVDDTFRCGVADAAERTLDDHVAAISIGVVTIIVHVIRLPTDPDCAVSNRKLSHAIDDRTRFY